MISKRFSIWRKKGCTRWRKCRAQRKRKSNIFACSRRSWCISSLAPRPDYILWAEKTLQRRLGVLQLRDPKVCTKVSKYTLSYLEGVALWSVYRRIFEWVITKAKFLRTLNGHLQECVVLITYACVNHQDRHISIYESIGSMMVPILSSKTLSKINTNTFPESFTFITFLEKWIFFPSVPWLSYLLDRLRTWDSNKYQFCYLCPTITPKTWEKTEWVYILHYVINKIVSPGCFASSKPE